MPAATSTRRPADPQKVAAARDARLAHLHDQLAAGVAAARSSQGWRAWLDVAARFPSYSLNNVLLIQAQRPGASMVCGYRGWQAIGRQVRKGEKGIYILAPILTRNPRNQPDPGETQGVGERIDLTDTTTAPPAKRPQRLVGFRPVAVFDLASTDGDPIPTPPRPQLLAGQAPEGLWDALAGVAADHGFTLTRCPDAHSIGGANGITDCTNRTITVRADIDPAQAVKTLAHKIGHATLHTPGAGQEWRCRGTAEVEAESVAYLVAAHHGMDTSTYTFDYIAGWAPDDQTVTTTANRVLQAARDIITTTDPQPEVGQQTADTVTAGRDAAHAVAEHAAQTQAVLARALAEREQQAAPATITAARIREINTLAAAWFTTQAADSEEFTNAAAQRGHDPAALIDLGVGWAPPGWSGLTDHLTAVGFSIDELQAAGVTRTSRNGRAYDLFRGRIMFPITDPTGTIAGFTGRDTTGRDGAPKYLNTPANDIYRKGQLLYGTAHIAHDTTQVVLVEGPWDALAVTQATRDSADPSVGLAACGTAITPHHLELATSLGRAIVLCPDPDPAGVAALGRTTDHLTRNSGNHPHAIALPPGTDSADLHAASGATGVRAALQSAGPAGIVYARSWLAINPPGQNPHDRVNAARAAAAHSRAMTATQRGGLAVALLTGAGITPETAIAVLAGTHPAPTPTGPRIVAPQRQPAAAGR